MPLVRLQTGRSDWPDIKDAADILWRSSIEPNTDQLRTALQNHYCDPSLTLNDLHTGFNASRRAVVVKTGQRITIAFEGSHPNELDRNLWSHGKGPGWWEMPYPVYTDGNRVHSSVRDMWHAMRDAACEAMNRAVDGILERGETPRRIVISGYSMGGGVSILAFTDLLQHIRSTWGSASTNPQSWAVDRNPGTLVQHFTFAAVAAADQGYYTVLNRLYEDHHIKAWDFMCHYDWTQHAHHFDFRSWRGHRYIIPDAVTQHCGAEFGDKGHCILGYLKAAEWMMENGTDQVKSAYSY